MDELDKAVRPLAKEIGKLQSDVEKLKKGASTPQLQNASITGTSIKVYDVDGKTPLQSIGLQGDGTVGTVALNGPVPPVPSQPALTAGQLSITVTWDGTFVDGAGNPAARPTDVESVQVHVSTSAGFEPDSSTLRGRLPQAGDLVVQPVETIAHYVKLVAITTSKVTSDPTAEVSATPAEVLATQITDEIVTTPKLAANAVTAGKLETELVLGTRIIAGNPAGARVEMNSGGIEAHNDEGIETVNVSSAGDVAIAGTIQSTNFDNDQENGVTGWQLNADGSATITSAVIGSDNYFIDSSGNSGFNDITVNGALTVNGSPLEDLLKPFARGVLALNSLPNTSAAYAGSPVLFGKITIENFDATRQYKISGITRIDVNGGLPRWIAIDCHYNWTEDATADDPILFTIQQGGRDNATGAGTDWIPSFSHTIQNLTPPGTDLHLSFCLTSNTNGPRYEGTSYGRVWVEDVGQALAYGTYDPGTEVTPPQQRTKTYNATWSRAWNSSGSVYSTNGTLVQGEYSSSAGGNRRSWIGFPYSTIQSDLSGATVVKVEVYLYFDHWYWGSGGTAVLGFHKSTANSAPSYDGDLDWVDEKRVSGWGRNVGKWVDITTGGAFTADGWRTGAHTGIMIGPGPSSDLIYYGKARGYSQTHAPQLRITYNK